MTGTTFGSVIAVAMPAAVTAHGNAPSSSRMSAGANGLSNAFDAPKRRQLVRELKFRSARRLARLPLQGHGYRREGPWAHFDLAWPLLPPAAGDNSTTD